MAEKGGKKLPFGHTDAQLSEEGIEQAKKLAERLKNEKIDSIYSSDLKRAKHTAQEVAKFHPHCKINYTPEIREQNLGVLEAVDLDQHEEYKKHGWKIFHAPEGGESRQEVRKRADEFLQKLLAAHGRETVLVIAHGVFNGGLISVIRKMDFESIWQEYKLDNTCINIFEITEDGVKTELHDCTKHLH